MYYLIFIEYTAKSSPDYMINQYSSFTCLSGFALELYPKKPHNIERWYPYLQNERHLQPSLDNVGQHELTFLAFSTWLKRHYTH